jgi:MinD-like ATPase involved in chromosome partitioning or flagellar assembly
VVERHRPFEPDPGNAGGGKEMIITIHSYKGGTGKTLFSVNLALSLANRGNRVCLLDFDFRAPSLHAIFKKAKTEYLLNDYLNGIYEIDDVLTDCGSNYLTKGKLSIGFADSSIDALRDMVSKDRNWEMKALHKLLSLKESLAKELHFDYVIFDTGPGLQYSSINAIVIADFVYVITTFEKSDVEGTQRMISDLYELFKKKTEVIVNKIPNGFLHSENQKSIEILRLPIIGAIPCSCDILKTKGNFFVAAEKPNHPFTKTIEKIATKIEHQQLQYGPLLTLTQL